MYLLYKSLAVSCGYITSMQGCVFLLVVILCWWIFLHFNNFLAIFRRSSKLWAFVACAAFGMMMYVFQINGKPEDVALLPGTDLRVIQGSSPFQEKYTVTSHATSEVRHIGFLKVHKAASSTMQNLFFRFGLKRNLTFVFTQHPNYFSRNSKSHLPLAPPKYRKGYDILCNHGVFNHKIYSSLLPTDTVYIGIVRDPLTVFISGVNYYTQKSQALRYLVKIPPVRIRNLIQHADKFDPTMLSYTRNVMARDFGFEPRSEKNYTNPKLQELGRIFKLVLIVEHFEESLILMKRYLNWKVQDILFIPTNVYSKDSGESILDLSPDDLEKFRRRNSLDYETYDFFYKKFWTQFNAESSDIHMEVLNFRQILNMVLTFCHNANTGKATNDDPKTLTVHKTEWNEEFQVLATDCDFMKKEEQSFITYLRQVQGSELRRPKVARPRLLHGERLKVGRQRYSRV